ncbi:hypothetical protein EVAR_52826_1 [Eumeta japonica]|uniref:Uncharacterized protein n=1 Tax=Eumeta variegata TaxID=151549 RepID=A0A4C1YE35_EUMVA|nr:hypothetical protein EVAR_52826_1 [Eumeta japonica]
MKTGSKIMRTRGRAWCRPARARPAKVRPRALVTAADGANGAVLLLKILVLYTEHKRGRINLGDKFLDGHSSTAVTNENIDVMRCMIETGRHVMYHDIRASLGIDSRMKEEVSNLVWNIVTTPKQSSNQLYGSIQVKTTKVARKRSVSVSERIIAPVFNKTGHVASVVWENCPAVNSD